jgi:hypothetical protein
MAIVGAVSAWKEWRVGLGMYFVLLALLAIITISIGIAVYVKKDDANNVIAQGWTRASLDTKITLQNAFNCCGGVQFNTSIIGDPKLIDPSLIDAPQPCPMTSRTGYVFKDGDNVPIGTACVGVMADDFAALYKTAGSCGIAFSVLMLVALAFICYLMSGIRAKGMNAKILKNRERTARERTKKGGKSGLKIPESVL